ncbi:hypothetical protein F0225_16700 [Vibrio pectenicida]|uniref:OTU domain-containing protein n=1 Tax=Vibrio pectenicida TaxID=62763 RepID=A0A7Y4A1F0_9VIBR|nr:hypothetical protein [Vibrio pectenicida]NOH72960.1 hypothetical protein [Vibrio pectenicida]
MISATTKIAKIPSNRSIYSEGEHNPTIESLLNGATNGMKLNDSLNDSTPKNYLDMLFSLAKTDHQESIELLQNLSCSSGEIAVYSQDLLCKLIARENETSYEAACSVRSGCQVLVTQYSSGIITDEVLNTHPKLLLFAASKIKGDEGKVDTTPSLLVKSKIEAFNRKKIKPQWWLDIKLENGQFSTPKPDDIKDKDYLVEKLNLLEDGACQFRAALVIKYAKQDWLTADKAAILHKIEDSTDPNQKPISDLVKQSICDALNDIINIVGLNVPAQFKDAFEEEHFAENIYTETIQSKHFNLYSRAGIEAAINKDSSTEQEKYFLDLLTDIIGQKLVKALSIPLSSKENKAYAVPTGNHYNLIVPVDYFSKTQTM